MKETTIKFLNYRVIAFAVSLILFIVFLLFTISKGGVNLGVDFVGGVKVIAKFDKSVDESKIRSALTQINPIVQQIGESKNNDYMISVKSKNTSGTKSTTLDEKQEKEIRALINASFPNVQYKSFDLVGPTIGESLQSDSVWAFITALILMSLYLAFRFEFKYAVGALAALIHDITLAVAFCGMTGVEVNVPVIAALLTIFGYSVNDTIVIFDRIRENVRVKSKQTFIEAINKSISQSLSRTLLTSLTTLFAVLTLYLIGGEGLNEFALVLLFGIFVGTYSSIYIASPVLLAWEKFKSR